MKVSYFASPITTPQSVAMVRSRLEVREAVIGSRMACRVRMGLGLIRRVDSQAEGLSLP
ncbi:hypothetical protein [Thiocapsa sp. UBA6158]|jgi:hypothetical protein|uniref:hypothetical protein n=1 Tax=Thiocapsa sp. UBA6158 TaxID=1947692 RepID=UPI0025D58DFC|nr:hypothetical protein [Thiocapsa sp. UBA6158]